MNKTQLEYLKNKNEALKVHVENLKLKLQLYKLRGTLINIDRHVHVPPDTNIDKRFHVPPFKIKKAKPPWLIKGSKEARNHMAEIRNKKDKRKNHHGINLFGKRY